MAQLFLDSYAEMLGDIEKALSESEWEALSRGAHTLRGALSILSDEASQEAALALERAGREGNADEARKAYRALEPKVDRLRERVTTFLTGT